MPAPPLNVGSPLPPRLHLRRPLSQFDPRAHVGRCGLYSQLLLLPPEHAATSQDQTKN